VKPIKNFGEDFLVEVMRRYYNPPRTPVDLEELLGGPPFRNASNRETAPALTQSQRRLRPHDLARLVADYVAGATIEDLAVTYGVNRTTVYAHLDRAGADRPTRGRRLSEPQIRQAVETYGAGASISALAAEFCVDEETVRRAFRCAGVRLRNPR
jgi:uncharacterized protein (DUF433 family)